MQALARKSQRAEALGAGIRAALNIKNPKPKVIPNQQPQHSNQPFLPDHNRVLYAQTRESIHYGHYHLEMALGYAVKGFLVFPSSSRRFIPKEALDDRNWQLCVNFKMEIQALHPDQSHKPFSIAFPIAQLPNLLDQLERIYQLETISMDSEANKEEESQKYLQRLPGPLFGDHRNAYFLSIWRPNNKQSKIAKPMAFLSKHSLEPNVYHAWLPKVLSIPLAIDCLPNLHRSLRNLMNYPEVYWWATKQQQRQQQQNGNQPSIPLVTSDHLQNFLRSLLTPNPTRSSNIDEFSRDFLKPKWLLDREYKRAEISSVF